MKFQIGKWIMNRGGIEYITITSGSGWGKHVLVQFEHKKKYTTWNRKRHLNCTAVWNVFFFFLDNSICPTILGFFFPPPPRNFCLSTSVTSCTYLLLRRLREYFVIHEELHQSSLSHVILHCISFLFQMKWMGVALWSLAVLFAGLVLGGGCSIVA